MEALPPKMGATPRYTGQNRHKTRYCGHKRRQAHHKQHKWRRRPHHGRGKGLLVAVQGALDEREHHVIADAFPDLLETHAVQPLGLGVAQNVAELPRDPAVCIGD
eukprot:3817341-Rhodomonas_salina.2